MSERLNRWQREKKVEKEETAFAQATKQIAEAKKKGGKKSEDLTVDSRPLDQSKAELRGAREATSAVGS